MFWKCLEVFNALSYCFIYAFGFCIGFNWAINKIYSKFFCKHNKSIL